MPSIVRETVILSLLIMELSRLQSVDCHQAANPLQNNGMPQHHHMQHQQQVQQPHQQNQQHQQPQQVQQETQGARHPAAHHAGHGMDRNAVHNQQHIIDDLDGKINKPTDSMTEEELQFHYFKVHDYNNDDKLDGIELIAALTHHNGESDEKLERTPDSELTRMIDGILEDNDINGDGFIDYPEFLITQRKQNS